MGKRRVSPDTRPPATPACPRRLAGASNPRPIVDPHHHLWGRPGWRNMVHEPPADTNSEQNTVAAQCRALPSSETLAEGFMRTLKIGDVTIASIIERDGPWRKPADMFPAYDPEIGAKHLATLDPEIFDPATGMMVITYQTFVVRTPHHTILVDTCTGEDKGYPAPMDFPKQRYWTNSRPRDCRSRRSTTCSALICTSIIAAGTRSCVTDAGCRPSRMQNMFSTSGNMRPGSRRRRREAAPGQRLALQLRADRRGGTGAAGG